MNSFKLQAFEDELARKEPVDVSRNFHTVEALYEEARILGVFPLKDPLQGIEFKTRLAKALNGVR